MEIRKVRKVGNSLALTLPKGFLEYLEIYKNDYVRIDLTGESIVVRKLKSKVEVS